MDIAVALEMATRGSHALSQIPAKWINRLGDRKGRVKPHHEGDLLLLEGIGNATDVWGGGSLSYSVQA